MPTQTPEEIESDRKEARRYLAGAGFALILAPLMFWVRYREVGPLGWGLTIFLVAICLLVAVGFQFGGSGQPAQPAIGGWLDRLGSFWLLACAGGGLAGWLVTSTVLPVTEATWRWQYGARILLAIIMPVVTMLPLIRYVRGRLALLALAILIVVTLLPLLSAAGHLGDFLVGPITQAVQLSSQNPKECSPEENGLLLVPCEDELWESGGSRVQVKALLFTRRILKVENLD